jgi:16S rRNA (cytidine1402-2'-O)-methyltransferase
VADAAGRLLVVGTPIGNLGDLTSRAAEALSSADLVVAEDTRVTARLLSHLGVRRPMISFNDHNATARLPDLLSRLASGKTLALTTDAGMPAVSDPGARLVAEARDAGHRIEVIPGPAAVTAAVALAGVEAAGFVFGGFLPPRPAGARRDALAALRDAAASTGLPLVLYEAPHRIHALLSLLAEVAPGDHVVLARELTKRHEEVIVGCAAELLASHAEPRGEYTVVIQSQPQQEAAPSVSLDLDGLVRAAVGAGLGQRTIVELLRGAGLSRRDAYARARPSLER